MSTYHTYIIGLIALSATALCASLAHAQSEDISQHAVDGALSSQTQSLDQLFNAATQASSSGELDKAIENYQTILSQDSSLDRVRLDLGLAFFKSGRLSAARQQFNIVLEKQIPDIVRRNVETIIKQIDVASKEHFFNGSAAIGVNFDTNANSASSTGKVSVLDTDFILSPQDTRKSDSHAFATVSINHRWQPMTTAKDEKNIAIAKPSPLSWSSSMMAYKSEQDTLDNLNISLFGIKSGPEYKLADGQVTLGLEGGYTDVILAGHSYMHSYLGEASVNWFASQQDIFNATLTQEYRDFMNSPTSSTFEERNGQASQTKLGYTYIATPQDIFALNITVRAEDTRVAYNTNWSWSPNATYTRVSKGGSFAQFTLGYKNTNYAGADSFISTRTREDQEKSFGLTLGTPLNDRITWIVGYNYRFTNSNLQNYQNDNQRVSTTLAAKF